jgi:G3E family GTPase
MPSIRHASNYTAAPAWTTIAHVLHTSRDAPLAGDRDVTEPARTPTPTTLVTGALGVGKTTAILGLLARQPPDARWAVLVNEFGEIGIDGAALDRDGLAVREIPGGCICCTAGVALQVALVRLLREVRPTRLLIEPTGLAHPASVVDALRRPGIRESVARRATITLVDPRHVTDPRWRASEAWRDQVEAADVLVATKTDLCAPCDIDAFRAFALELWPPPIAFAEIADGALDPSWLDLDPSPGEHGAGHAHLHDDGEPVPAPPGARAHRTAEAETCGWTWSPDVVFDLTALREVVQGLARPGGPLPAGALRLKGLFRTPGAWVLVQADPDAVRATPTGWRRDSRIEVIAPPLPKPDWHAVDAALRAALRRPGPA